MATTVERLQPCVHGRARSELRSSEMLFLGFLVYAEVASLLFPLPNAQRAALVAINTTAAGIIFLLARRLRTTGLGEETQSSLGLAAAFGALRDWLPCLLIILAYREAALFSAPQPLHPLNWLFERWDLGLLGNSLVVSIRAATSPWLDRTLEFAYLLCYPVVPLGFAVIYSLSRRLEPDAAGRALDRFWTGVLLALLTCYALFAFFPLMTPRLLYHDLLPVDSPLALRRFNLWLLGRFAGAGCVFPSGHVAGATAVALSVWKQSRRWGTVFIIIAASIATATVLERYHYAADALAGMLIAVAAVWVSRRFLGRPSRRESEGGPSSASFQRSLSSAKAEERESTSSAPSAVTRHSQN